MLVAGYTRVSTEEQATQGYSLDAQLLAITKVCKDKGWDLYRIYSDQGLSAKDMLGRPALLELLDDAEARCFQLVLFTSLDRLTRDTKDYQDIRALLLSYGSSLGETSNPDADLNDPFVKLMLDLKSAIADFERRLNGARTKRAMTEAKRQGLWMGKIPLGYVIKEDGKLGLSEQGKSINQRLQDEPRLKATTIAREFALPYKTAWDTLHSIKRFGPLEP